MTQPFITEGIFKCNTSFDVIFLPEIVCVNKVTHAIKKCTTLLLNSIRFSNVSYAQQLFSFFSLLSVCFGYSKDAELEMKDSVYRQEFAHKKVKETSRYSQHCDSVLYAEFPLHHHNDRIVIEDHSVHNIYYNNPHVKDENLSELAKEWYEYTFGLVVTILSAIIVFFVWVSKKWEWIVCFLPKDLRKKLKKYIQTKINVL